MKILYNNTDNIIYYIMLATKVCNLLPFYVKISQLHSNGIFEGTHVHILYLAYHLYVYSIELVWILDFK